MNQKTAPLSCGALSDFSRQMAQLLRAGFPLGEGLSLLAEDSEPGAAPLLLSLAEGVEAAMALAPALEQSGVFPDYYLRMVHLGEETGCLDEVMEALARHYDREQAIRDSLRTAAVYPAVMVSAMLVILAVLLSQVMPVFDRVFAQLGTRLTGLARMLLDLGEAIHVSSLGLAAFVLVLAGLLFWLRSRKDLAVKLLRRLPWFRRILHKLSLCRFTDALALGLKSGLSTHYALELAGELNDDPALTPKLTRVREKLEQGEDLIRTLTDCGILSGQQSRMALVGRRTGNLDAALAQVADSCRKEADDAVNRAIAAIEPGMVLVLSVLVGIVLMSVLFPLLGILASL